MGGMVEWVIGWANTPSAATALFIIAFAESSFFPIPPDILLITIALLRPEEAFVLAGICSAGSVLGGIFGYILGFIGGRPLLHKLFSEKKIRAVKDAFEKYEVWAISIAGFTPVPYKVFTVSAGAFEIPFKPFVAASFLSRSARFFLVASCIYFWGDKVRDLLTRYFNWFTLAFMVLLIGGFLVVKMTIGRSHTSKSVSQAPGPKSQA